MKDWQLQDPWRHLTGRTPESAKLCPWWKVDRGMLSRFHRGCHGSYFHTGGIRLGSYTAVGQYRLRYDLKTGTKLNEIRSCRSRYKTRIALYCVKSRLCSGSGYRAISQFLTKTGIK
jgi:hypothetical protein